MKYRFYCENCQAIKYEESLLIPSTCPVDIAHTIRSNSIVGLQEECEKDYKRLRKELAEFVVANSNNLTEEQLKVASQNFVVPQEIRNTFYSLEEQMELGRVFHNNSVKARAKRINVATIECFNRLELQQTFELVQEMSNGQLIRNYVDYGIEGTSEGDPVGIYDYLNSTATFSEDGLLNKNWNPIGTTIIGLKDRLMAILRDGDY